ITPIPSSSIPLSHPISDPITLFLGTATTAHHKPASSNTRSRGIHQRQLPSSFLKNLSSSSSPSNTSFRFFCHHCSHRFNY
ncbi:hypothetical protein G4B88_019886, partial [Cannabis sativa]